MALDFSIFGGGTTGSVATTTSTTTFGLFGTSSLTPLGGLSSGNALGTTGGGIFGGGTTTGTTTTTTSSSSFGLFGPSTGLLSGGFGFGFNTGGLFPGLPAPVPAPVQVGPQGINVSLQMNESDTAELGFNSGHFAVADGDAVVSFQVSSLPSNGTLKLSGSAISLNETIALADFNNVTYDPDANFSGVETFTIAMSTDGSTFDSTPSTVTINVLDDTPSDPSIVAPPAMTFTEGSSDNAIGGAITGSFSDPDAGDSLAFVHVTAPAGATSTVGTFTYDPAAAFPTTFAPGQTIQMTAAEAATLTYSPPASVPTANIVTSISFQLEDSTGLTSGSGSLPILVADGNDAPTVATAPVSLTAAENQTSVTGTQPAFTDEDGDTLSYSLTGADASLLSVDSSGTISLASAQDFEALTTAGSTILNATLKASDGSLAASTPVSVTITNVDDEAPVITAQTAAATVSSEDSNGDPAESVLASDSGAGAAGTSTSASLTYAITSGNSAGVFAINASNGDITIVDDVALKAIGAATSYTLGVAVTDADGNASTESFVIDVTDDSVPVVTAATINVDEDTPVGTVVHTVVATDNVAVTDFTITGATSLFEIDSAGNISIVAELDADAGGSSPTVSVIATDGTNSSSAATITLNLVDVIDEAPTFSTGAITNVDEATTAAVATITVSASDNGALTSNSIEYSLSGTDSALFSVDVDTGAISFVNAPDYENPDDADGDNTYEFDIVATDAAGLTGSTAVSISVDDVNEAPTISDVTIVMAEGGVAPVSSLVDLAALMGFSDPELDEPNTLAFIDSSAPVTPNGVEIGTANTGFSDFFSLASTGTDYAGTATLKVTIADDGASAATSQTATITFDIQDLPDPPELSGNGAPTAGTAVTGPTDLPLTAPSVGFSLATLSVSDPDLNETFVDADYEITVTPTSGTSLTADDFAVSGGVLKYIDGTGTGPNATGDNATVTVTVTDQFGLTDDWSITVEIA